MEIEEECLKKNQKLIFKSLVGSSTYGTFIPGISDQDYKGIYIQPLDEILGFDYREQIEIGKDECYYEVRRFLQLVQSANPTMLEMLFMPEDSMLHRSKEFDMIIEHRHKFLTKKCLMSFAGYAIDQIKKAKGLNKKMNWEMSKVTRKTPLDFCYVYEDGKTMLLESWLLEEKKLQDYCGLTALNHFKDSYALYYDYNLHYAFQNNRPGKPLGFRGIIKEDSNDLRLSSVDVNIQPEVIVYYNKDGYIVHCKDYKEYTIWLEKRNTQRYVDTTAHDQKIDGKNLLHCRRLLDMAMEIPMTNNLTVRRSNAAELLKIRRGEVSLEEIISKAEEDIKGLDKLYEDSTLPDEVDKEFVNELLLKIRKHAYNL